MSRRMPAHEIGTGWVGFALIFERGNWRIEAGTPSVDTLCLDLV